MRDILDNFVGLLLAQGKVVARGIELADYIDKRINGKGIMLAAHTKVRHLLGRAFILALEQVGLVEHLAGVGQEFRAVHGQGDALRGAGEDLDAQLVLQFADKLGAHGDLPVPVQIPAF